MPPSPYRVVATRKKSFTVTLLAASPGSYFGILDGVPVEVGSHRIKLRHALLAGLKKLIRHGFGVTNIAGRWPDMAFLTATNDLVGDVFSWRANRWRALHPRSLKLDSGGYYDGWTIGPWKGGVLALHDHIGGFQEWILLAGRTGAMPAFGTVPQGCSAALHRQSAFWNERSEVIVVGEPCPKQTEASVVAHHWRSGATKPSVMVLPSLPIGDDGDYVYLSLVSVTPSELYVVGNMPRGKGRTTAYLARYDGKQWTALQPPVLLGKGTFRGHAPGDGTFYVSDAKTLWRREADSSWTVIPLPRVPGAREGAVLGIDGMWRVSSGTWLAGTLWFGRPNQIDTHVILHSGVATIPSPDEIAAAMARGRPRP